ncbi:MAG: hypothetical protein LBD55_08270 [Treponema sp.]|jgi:hypothetical protein|nr:hypothetical protein [Treponema sp.]
MKKHLVFIGITGIAVFAGCRGTPKETRLQWTAPPPVQDQRLYLIIDHKNSVIGETVPGWVNRYDNGGLRMIEYLLEYQDKYVFIGKNSGTNFNALRQWVSGFRISHDFARLVSDRIQARLTHAAVSFPDQDYGAFFEVAVKASSDAVYRGAVKEADFWIKKRYFKENGVAVDREAYDFLILVSIDKILLKSQIDAILNNTEVAIPPTQDQIAAVNRIKAVFYDGF